MSYHLPSLEEGSCKSYFPHAVALSILIFFLHAVILMENLTAVICR